MLSGKLKNDLKYLGVTAALFASAGLTQGAFAQEDDGVTTIAEQEVETAEDEGDAIVVVGSRIRRDEFSSSSPITVITRDESLLAGLASTTDILQSASVSGGGNQINNYFGGFVVDGGPGVNTLSLRGLGATKTLILLNGRRLAPAGTRGAVGSADLNVLPNALVERIEILKDGASSIYGSDAVAGVVDIITERGVEGLSLEGQYNKTVEGGGDTIRASMVTGYTADRWEVSGSLEYTERTELRMGQRDWTECNRPLYRDPATGESTDYIDPLTGEPKCYPISATGTNGVTINTIGTSSVYTFPDFGGSVIRPGIAVAPGAPESCATALGTADCFWYANRWRPNAAVTDGLLGFEAVGGAYIDPALENAYATSLDIRDTFDPDMLNASMVSPVKNYTGFVQGSYDLQALGDAEVYVELLGTKRMSSQTGYRQHIIDYPVGSPLLPDQFDSLLPLGNTGTGYLTQVRAFIGWGNDRSSQEVDFFKGVAGITGALPADWRYDAYLSYATSDASYTFQSFLADRQIAAATGCVGTEIANCVSAPFMNADTIGGNLPEAYRNFVFEDVTGKTKYDETILSFIVDGPVFTLPAGEVQAAMGFEHRSAEIDDQPPEDSVNGNLYNLTTAAPTVGDDSVNEVFGEIDVPLLANKPLAEELRLNMSARYTDYESYGEDTTYKVGLNYSPTDWLGFRTSYGTSFRAPALFEQYQGATTGFLSANSDPCYEYGGLNTSSFRYQNCNAEIGDPLFRPTSGITVVNAGGAGVGLEAETSTNFSVGFVLQPELPSFYGDLAFAVDYYEIEIVDEVTRLGAGTLLALCYDDPDFRAGGSYCRYVRERDPANGNSLTVDDQYTNIATQIVEGFDYNLRWVRDFGEGTFRFNAEVTQYTEQSSKLFDDDPLDDVNGTINNPEMVGSFDFTYNIKDWRVGWRTTWIDEMDSDEYFELTPEDDIYDFDVPNYFLHSVSATYTSPREWQLTAGVRNVFDEEPPVISGGAYSRIGNSPIYSGYDYFGRQLYVNARKKF